MKKHALKLLTLALLVILPSSCSKDDHGKSRKNETSDYTIIYYGHGGGNLDMGLLSNLFAMYGGNKGSYSHVNICAQYKFSSAESIQGMLEQMEMFADPEDLAEMKVFFEKLATFSNKTARFIVHPSDAKTLDQDNPLTLPVFNENNLYGLDNADITCADSLTNFINWAARVRPARKYILIVSDHGGGYRPDEELPDAQAGPSSVKTRGLVYDDGHNNTHFTAKSFARAISRAEIRPCVLYYDACLMNNAEYFFELSPLCDYIVASTFNVPGRGGDYSALINALARTPDDIETALTAFVKSTVNNWDQAAADEDDGSGDPVCHDMSVFRTDGTDRLGAEIRAFVDKLLEAYKSGDEAVKAKIDDITANAYKVEESAPYYDLIDYFVNLSIALPDVFGSALDHPLGQAYDDLLVYQQSSRWIMDNQCPVDLSVLLGCNGHYTVDGYLTMQVNADGTTQISFLGKTENGTWPSTFGQTYCQTRFDQLTGWSRWLMANGQEPNKECFTEYNPFLPNQPQGKAKAR